MNENKLPRLSICIPTYNRAKFLRVMLEALLPQTVELGGKIEVLILDNCSTDETPDVVSSFGNYPALRAIRHEKNLGPAKNICYGPSQLASGEYCWVLGDHNLMRPRMLKKIVDELGKQDQPTIHYTNFRCANYPEHWPSQALGGYDGIFEYIADENLKDETLPAWYMVLKPETSMGTQAYAHIVPTSIWKTFWKNREIGPDYTDSATTYPHTTMLAISSMNKAVVTLSEPSITIFNNAQSWSNPDTAWKVYVHGLPSLIQLLAIHGFPKNIHGNLAKRIIYPNLQAILSQKLKTQPISHVALQCATEPNIKANIRLKLATMLISQIMRQLKSRITQP